MKSGQVQLIQALRVCQSYVAGLSKLTRTSPTPLVGPPELKLPAKTTTPRLQLVYKSGSSAATCAPKIPASYGDPCLDLYFKVTEDTVDCRKTMNQLLPLAWSHNPLTTLKLIYNMLDNRLCLGKNEDELFYAAAFWLHENHPQTLARNVVPIVELGDFRDVLEVLLGVLEGENANSKKRRKRRGDDRYDYLEDFLWGEKSMPKRRMKRIDTLRKAVETYRNDPDYQLLHERVSDLYAVCLKFDIQNLKKYEQKKNDANDHCNSLKLTLASEWCPSVDTFFDEATLICESIARKIFPREERTQGVCIKDNEEKEEADYVSKIKKRLMKEVLEPLREYMTGDSYDDEFSKEDRSSVVKKYLKGVEAGDFEIQSDALLPHEIIRFVNDQHFGKVTEPQWKAMVEEMYSKQGKFNNCLAVCDVSGRMSGHPTNVSLGLGLLVSELSEEPWKGKVITFSRNPQLLSIQGDDLMSKCLFMMKIDNQDWHGDTNFQKVFDLILEAAVNGNLKPEQMVKRVFVLTSDQDFDDASGRTWETDYERIQRKFRERGYGDVVPRIVFWDLRDKEHIPVAHYAKRGVATLTGYSPHFVKLFFDNDGEIGPNRIMEAAVSHKRYQSLAVVD